MGYVKVWFLLWGNLTGQGWNDCIARVLVACFGQMYILVYLWWSIATSNMEFRPMPQMIRLIYDISLLSRDAALKQTIRPRKPRSPKAQIWKHRVLRTLGHLGPGWLAAKSASLRWLSFIVLLVTVWRCRQDLRREAGFGRLIRGVLFW